MLVKRKRGTKPKQVSAKTAAETDSGSILDRLSNPALPSKIDDGPETSKKLRSSFFFRLGGDQTEEARRKALTEKPMIPRSERELDERAELYKEELPDDLEQKISEVREYLLRTVNPLVLAAQVGAEQAFAVLGKATDSEVEREFQNKLQIMLQKGVNLKLSRFVVEYLGLKPRDAAVLLERTPPSTIVFPSLKEVQPEHPIGNRREQPRNRK